MASPSGTSRKEGVKCDGIIKKGARKGQECKMLLLAKDSLKGEPSIECPRPQCHHHMSISALLSKAVKIWGEPFRKAALTILTEENQEKRSQGMSKNKIKEKRTVVQTVGLGSRRLLEVEELLPFAKGEEVSYMVHHPGYEKKFFKVKEVHTHWDVDPGWEKEKGIFIERWVYLEEVK